MIFSAGKPKGKTDDKWSLLHRQVCGYIRQWIDDNVLNHAIGETHAQLKFMDLGLNSCAREKTKTTSYMR